MGGMVLNRRELLDKLSASAEERVLLGRLWDGGERCRSRNVPEASGFLSPHEQALAGQLMQALGDREGFAFWGGCEGAQRRQLHFLPDWMDGPDETAVRCLRCRCYETDHPTHRDFLGSLMGLGLTREKVGEILVSPHWADVLVGSSVADFLLREWKQAGRVPLRVAEIGLEEIAVPEQPVKLIRDTVASLRLDSVAAAGFSISRSAAAELIRSGKAEVNWMPRGWRMIRVVPNSASIRFSRAVMAGWEMKSRLAVWVMFFSSYRVLRRRMSLESIIAPFV